jgi:hypothetical protein
MKHINKQIALAALGTLMFLNACQEVELAEPNISTTATASSANFLLVNASPDAPSLDLFVNNLKIGDGVSAGGAQSVYGKVTITSNGGLANTSIKAKPTTGTIGGVLGGNSLILRAGNNNTNNFQAFDSVYYTFIVLDSVSRPKPIRLLNAKNLGDTTYFDPLKTRGDSSYISVTQRRKLQSYTKSRTVAIGTVPLGSSDPGGIRFFVITDQVPLPSAIRFPKPSAGKCAVRIIHAVPNSGAITATVEGQTVLGALTYPLLFPASLSPSVGSRSVVSSTNPFITVSFSTINSGVSDIDVKQGGATIANAFDYDFQSGGVYTIVISGNFRDKPNLPLTIIKNK